MTLEINLYELTAPFECCILESKWVKKVLSSNLLRLRWEMSLCRMC
jgi:hypothetical protein